MCESYINDYCQLKLDRTWLRPLRVFGPDTKEFVKLVDFGLMRKI